MRSKSHPTFTIGTVVAATIFAIVVGVLVAGFEGACGGFCSQAPPGVHAVFNPPLTSGEVAAVTVTGPCGPVPSPICDPKVATCDGRGWDIYIPTDAAGTCAVHVVLTDGETFDDTVSLSYSSGCGVGGYYGDHPILISSKILDAGAE